MTEPLDPNKYHTVNPTTKRRLVFVGLFFFLILLPFLLGTYYRVAVRRPSQSGKEVNTEIEKGEGVTDIAQKLQQEGAINSAFLFNIYVYLGNQGKNIQAGTYKIPAGSSLVEVVDIIQHGTNDVSLTFLEGWRVEEFARRAALNLDDIDFQHFVEMAADKEGYLFPDTYYLNRDVEENVLIRILTDNFEKKTKDLLTEENLTNAGLTKEEAIIFASMVEREIHSGSDRPVIAGILIKRWREGMQLDVDATTQYAVITDKLCGSSEKCFPALEDVQDLNWWPPTLSSEDLDLDSPYNTRKNAGLPPTPISNPSLASIEAVLFYEETPYYFYLTDSNGDVHYASTLDEHNMNVARFIQ